MCRKVKERLCHYEGNRVLNIIHRKGEEHAFSFNVNTGNG